MFSENTNLNSSKVKVFALFFPALLLIIFALAVNWVPSFIEEQRSTTPPLEKRLLVINEVIEKLKSDDAVDKEGLIKIFDSAIKKEIATETYDDRRVHVYCYKNEKVIVTLGIKSNENKTQIEITGLSNESSSRKINEIISTKG